MQMRQQQLARVIPPGNRISPSIRPVTTLTSKTLSLEKNIQEIYKARRKANDKLTAQRKFPEDGASICARGKVKAAAKGLRDVFINAAVGPPVTRLSRLLE
jgi:hypothetical protein